MPRSDIDDEYYRTKKKKSKGKHHERDRERDHSQDGERDRSRDRERDRSRDRERGRSRDKERDRSRDKERDRSRDKERDHSRDRERDRSRDKERDRSRDRERGRSRDRERGRSREKERGRSRDKERDHSQERDKDYEKHRERKHKDKKHKEHKSEKKSKSLKSDVADLTPAEKFNIFKKQREAGKTEDSVVDDMFKDFIAAKLKEIEKETPDIPEKDKNSEAVNDSMATSVEEMKKYLDSELNNMAPVVKKEPNSEVMGNINPRDTNYIPDKDSQRRENNDVNKKVQCDIKVEPKPEPNQSGFVTTMTSTAVGETATMISPILPRSHDLKEEKIDEDDAFLKLGPQHASKTDINKTEDSKKSLGFKNFGIKLSLTSTELIQSGAVHKKGKRLEDGEVMSSSNSEDNSSDTEPELVEDDIEDDGDILETGSIYDTDDESKSRKKNKKKTKHKKKKSKEKLKEGVPEVGPDKQGDKRKASHRSRSRSRSPKKSKLSKERSNRSKSRERSKRSNSKDRFKRSRSKERSKKSKSRDESLRSRSKDRSKKSRSRSHSRSRKRRSRSRSNSLRSSSRSKRRSKDRSSRKQRSRSKSRDRKKDRSPIIPWRSSRYGDFDAFRYSSRKDRSPSKTPEKETEKLKEKERKRLEDLRSKIDKAKLREIAIKNAVSAARTGGAQLDVAIKAGGKSVEELTQYCKRIQDAEKAKKLARGEEVSSEEEIDLRPDEEDEIHHPFKMKEPGAIVMDIKNAKQLAIVTPQERLAQAGTLRLQFPVSSGSNHRDKEWVPVEPDPIAKQGFGAGQQLAMQNEQDKVFVEPTPVNVDISSIVSERLNAVRKLQENPNDVIAQQILNQAQHKASQWANSRNLPGQFLGSTGANVLSAEELMGNKKRQAWIKKDVFTSAAPVTSGIGMFLLQKMGWRMGEGLGKNNTGQKEPLMLDFKVDRKGLVTTGEGKKSAGIPKVPKAIAKDLSGKHPVSALGEFCNRRKWGAPRYEMIHESGPSHKKDFVFKVLVNGSWYQPSCSSNNKKLAKAASATVCLQELGMVPRDAT